MMKYRAMAAIGASMALASCTTASIPQEAQSPSATDAIAARGEGALALFPILDEEAGAGGNIVYSPASVSQAFGLLQLGADGETLAQLQTILPAPADAASLESHARDVEVSLANALWLSKQFRFRDSYVAAARARYDASSEQIDVADAEGTAARINGWADKETRGLIPTVVQPDEITPDLVAMLTNALYFEGKWDRAFSGGGDYPFLYGDGHEAPFHLMQQMMPRASADRDGWRALRLPYRNPRYAMDVIMPADRKVMAEAPSLDRIAAFAEALAKAEPRPTRVRLPRFEISWDAGLIPALQAVGLTLPFDRARADLARMAEPGQRPIHVGAVKQLARLQVFEEGTKAAAVTSVSIVVTSAPPPPPPNLIEFTVDRPFVVVLRDLEKKQILFIGRIAAPEAYEPEKEHR